MKIAAITITYNDDYKFDEWYQHYCEYKDELFMHIIVDNNSDGEYKKKLKEKFKGSHIIFRKSNGGCTGAYNDGISYALSCAEVDSIMLIGNDIKLQKLSATKLWESLFFDSMLGMVAPVLLEADSDIVSDFGCKISKFLVMQPYCEGEELSNVKDEIYYCEALTGGMNLAKREFYEKVGLQDEKLFMYSDEVDMGIRAKKAEFKMACIRDAISWHQHINENVKRDRRQPFSKYLMGRNKVYIAKKHFGLAKVLIIFFFYFFGAGFRVIQNLFKGDFRIIKDYIWVMRGSIMGLIGNMEPNKFSQPR